MNYFEAIRRREFVKAREGQGVVADSMDVRTAIVNRIHSGEITLAQGQAELRKIQRTAKANGKVTRDQAWRGK